MTAWPESHAPAWSAQSQAATPLTAAPVTHWQTAYKRKLLVTDLVMLSIAGALGVMIRFGADSMAMTSGGLDVSYGTFAVLIVLGWMLSLHVGRTRDAQMVGEGITEYRRIARASVMFFGCFAIASIAFKIDSSRGFLAITLPLGVALVMLGRKAWRVRLRNQRAQGAMTSNALVIGGVRSAQELTDWLGRHSGAGYRVTGVWVPDRDAGGDEWLNVPDSFVPVMGTQRSLATALTVSAAEVVVVTDTEHLGQQGLKELTWELESADVDLLVAPNVIDVSGSRLQLATVAKMPFLHVSKPTYSSAAAWPKTLFDKVGAAMILLLASPVFVATALAVKLTSPGGVFYRQERIGLDGNAFHMLKFRSMRQGSDAELADLLAESGQGDKPLGKLTNDPRVTRVGAFIRRFSIDELPQLINVLRGTMSLVGPRPQRQFEVDLYDNVAHRRLRVRPGMTGLWQVSGRSDLTWEDAIRLDTYYVENWSLTADVAILWRTVRTVATADGAR